MSRLRLAIPEQWLPRDHDVEAVSGAFRWFAEELRVFRKDPALFEVRSITALAAKTRPASAAFHRALLLWLILAIVGGECQSAVGGADDRFGGGARPRRTASRQGPRIS